MKRENVYSSRIRGVLNERLSERQKFHAPVARNPSAAGNLRDSNKRLFGFQFWCLAPTLKNE